MIGNVICKNSELDLMILVKLKYIVHIKINNICLIVGLICKKVRVDKREHAWVCFVGFNYSLN